jgi:hypothetical protein
MPVIPVNRVVDKKIIIGKRGTRGGEAKGVADLLPLPLPPPTEPQKMCSVTRNTAKSTKFPKHAFTKNYRHETNFLPFCSTVLL